ncbi:MFS transporter [Aquicella lusitana]|uniref:Putative MFS family arabinose efflux permease n=1 Tax=Aquicella lusitana TaxID=254246 RepID=A0A370GYC8_9COXI|nr:MFS transporter [Aquicella lusitana]RDI48601.1 putative MFS family arabinose efflux permease [Aquicella lusitana]VVC74022.1 Tetracycline resistance protein, class C [Aquicella lusitana]
MAMSQEQYMRRHFFITAAPLFLVLFIDSMGLGLVFPVLNELVINPNTNFISATVSANMRNIIYGVTIGLYMFCWFFGAAFLGDLSDQIGRKKSLMICLLGAFLGYLFSAFSVIFNSFTLLLIGRIIAGFTAGSQSIAQAAIVDISTSEHKARNLGLILFVISLGFIFGPLAGGILSDKDLLASFSYATPFYFAAAISLLNAILLQFLFKETFTHTEKLRIKLSHAIEIFISAFTNEKVRELSIILLVMIFGWSGFYSFISMFLLRVYHFSALQTGFYMGLMGVGFGIGTGFLVDPCTRYFTLKACVIGGSLIAGVCTLLTLLAPNTLFLWIIIVPLAAAIAIAYSTILTQFSNQVDEDSQGWVMGITGAIMAFAFGVNGVLVGALADLDTRIPLIIAFAGMTLAGVLMKLIFKGNHDKKN